VAWGGEQAISLLDWDESWMMPARLFLDLYGH